jgi:hypothetical protein
LELAVIVVAVHDHDSSIGHTLNLTRRETGTRSTCRG